MRQFLLSLAATAALLCVCSQSALAAANYVYHERTGNFVASPACFEAGGAKESCGRYVENTDRVGTPDDGFQIYSPETYTLRFKVEYQFFTNSVRVLYTTDGTNPTGTYACDGGGANCTLTPTGTTQMSTASYTCTFADSLSTSSCSAPQTTDVATATIPPQPAGTNVKYVVAAWHTGGGDITYGNSGPGGGFNCNTTTCATVHTYSVAAAPATPLIISEFRTFGPTGACDEFVEIYNNSDSSVVVNAFDGSAGFALARSNGNIVFTIPNNTSIPPRGHFLAVNNGGGCTGSFSGSGYPGGGATTTGDTTMNEDIPANAGIALFNTSNQANFTHGNRLDAVGATTEANTLYKEGAGYPELTFDLVNPTPENYSIVRDLAGGTPKDTGDNDADFDLVDTFATALCTSSVNFNCQRLGAPGPENLSSPIQRNAEIKASLVDTQCTGIAVNPTLPSACRFERRTGAGSGQGASPTLHGTLSIRRRFTNNTGAPVTRLRFRIVDITTLLPAAGAADLRAITSAQVTATCQSEGGTPHLCSDNPSSQTTIEGTTLETDAAGQPNGGGFNSTLSLATPLAAGASINVQFLLGVEQNGSFRFFVNVEALPAPSDAPAASATKAQVTGKRRAARADKK